MPDVTDKQVAPGGGPFTPLTNSERSVTTRLSSWDRRAASALFAVTLVLGAPGAFFGLPWGKGVEGASRILAGDVPYRDFWTMYAPGHFYAIAGIFWLFGKEVVVQALASVVVRAFSTVAFFVLLTRVGASRPASVFLSMVFMGMFWTTAPVLSSYALALPLLLAAIDRTLVYYQTGNASQLRWAGLFIGVAAFFKHDVAAYVAVGISISLFACWLLSGARRPDGWLFPTRAALRLLGVVVPIVAGTGLWIAWIGGMDAWEALIVFPATLFRDVRGEAYPSLAPPLAPVFSWLAQPRGWGAGYRAFGGLSEWILCHVPQYVFLAACLTLLRRRHQMKAPTIAIVALCLASMPWFWLAAQVQRNTHLYSMAVFSGILGTMAWRGATTRERSAGATRVILALVLLIYGVGLAIPPATSFIIMLRALPESRSIDRDGIRAILLRRGEYEIYEPLGRLVSERTRADERIYHGVHRHESIVINNPIIYTVAGRRSCCRYSELHPGVTDRASIQREIINDIERHDVRAIVIWNFGATDELLDGLRARYRAAVEDGGSTILNEYIDEHFEPVETFGQYVVMWRESSRPR